MHRILWHDGLWLNTSVMACKKTYGASRRAVLLDGERSSVFSVDQSVAYDCSLSPILYSIFNDLLQE